MIFTCLKSLKNELIIFGGVFFFGIDFGSTCCELGTKQVGIWTDWALFDNSNTDMTNLKPKGVMELILSLMQSTKWHPATSILKLSSNVTVQQLGLWSLPWTLVDFLLEFWNLFYRFLPEKDTEPTFNPIHYE